MQQANGIRRRTRRTLEKKTKRYRRICLAVSGVFLVLLLLYLGTVLSQYMDIREQEGLQNLYAGKAASRPFAFIASASAQEEPADVPERFAALWDINQELIGWIRAGDAVDGPVVYSGDNTYYMDHSFYQKKSASGTIFADEENAHWETDPYVILYGHNMRSGTMFGKLNRYRKLDYLQENPIVEFDTIAGESARLYVPFAIFDASMNADNQNFFYLRRFEDFRNGDVESIRSLISEVTERSLFIVPVETTEEDHILVLVTCSYTNANGRLMVFCRELREEETAEEMEALMLQCTKK